MASFTGVGDTTSISSVRKGETISVAISGTYNMTIALQREVGAPSSGAWETLKSWSTANATVAYDHTTQDNNETLRLIVLVDTSGTATATLTNSADEILEEIGIRDDKRVEKLRFRQSGPEIPSGQVLNIEDAAGLTINDVPVDNAVNVSETLAAADTLTVAESGKVFFLASATEFVTTLPAVAGAAGVRYTFIVKAAPSGASYTIVSPSADIVGHVLTSEVTNVADADTEASGATTITLVDGQAVKGDRVDVVCDGTNWFAEIKCAVLAGGTISGA